MGSLPLHADSPRTETPFFVVGGVVFWRVPSEFLPFYVPRSVRPSAVLLSALVPRSVFKHLMFKHTFRVPPAFRVPTRKRGHNDRGPLTPAFLSCPTNFVQVLND